MEDNMVHYVPHYRFCRNTLIYYISMYYRVDEPFRQIKNKTNTKEKRTI